MLTKLCTDSLAKPIITKTVDGRDVSAKSAFPSDKRIIFTVKAPRRLGASAVVLRVNHDGEPDMDLPLRFVETSLGWDVYTTELFLGEDCGDDYEGLFFYEFLFLRGADTLFTKTKNNVDFELVLSSQGRFRLLIHDKKYTTPEWFHGKIMYHVFVDRFAKGEGSVTERDDAVINPDWEHGIPQYPENNGDRYTNNVFFGGNLWGVIEKLDYLESLGVGIIYLSPVFKAYSNHKYDTGNYHEIDGMFGGEEAFDKLIAEADKRGIRIILDGVFNHTGDDSLYFDKYGKYGGTGAYTNPDSEYRSWYTFKRYPRAYESWWGIDILPKLNHKNEECRDFFVGKGGVVEKYVQRGIGGWRLDVADELPNDFLDKLRAVAKGRNPDAVIIGEVWENAVDKVSYGLRRRYFGGKQLDSVMNYPLKNGIVDFIRFRDANILGDILKELYSSYPECVCNCLMNILGTHDTERILTVIGYGNDPRLSGEGVENSELAVRRMNTKQRTEAEKLLKLAAVIQYTVFGVPSVYYGDEVGMEGYHDPFCRMPFPWGREDTRLLKFYRKLGKIRRENDVFSDGEFKILTIDGGFIAYSREKDGKTVTIAVNRSEKDVRFSRSNSTDLLTGKTFDGVVKSNSAVILR